MNRIAPTPGMTGAKPHAVRRRTNHFAATITLAALVASGCSKGQPAPAAEDQVPAVQVTGIGELGERAEIPVADSAANDEALGPPPDPATTWIEREAITDSLPLFRWVPGEGNRQVGHIPSDFDPNLGVAVGKNAIGIWRYRGDAGDFIDQEPWLVRFGQGGISLGYEGIYHIGGLHWLPGLDLFAVHQFSEVRLFDPAGRLVQELDLTPDKGAGTTILQIAVNPADDRIAAVIFHSRYFDTPDERPHDLVVFDARGNRLSSVEAIAPPVDTGGFISARMDLHWLPDGRIAFARREEIADDPDPDEWTQVTEMLAIADPVQGTVEVTGIEIVPWGARVLDVDRVGRLLFHNGQVLDSKTGEVHDLKDQGTELTSYHSFSPDGAWIAGTGRGESDGASRIGAVHVADRTWHEIGNGIILGWAPDGALYWVGTGPRP